MSVELRDNINDGFTHPSEEAARLLTLEEREQRIGMFIIAATKGTASVALPGAIVEIGSDVIVGNPYFPISK
jgi:hypothetical protein